MSQVRLNEAQLFEWNLVQKEKKKKQTKYEIRFNNEIFFDVIKKTQKII